MPNKDFHMNFRDVASISLLFAALEKSFPLFRRVGADAVVEDGGKETGEKVLRTLVVFSTSFPQKAVRQESQ